MRFGILGPTRVERDGQPLAVGGQGLRALVALLLTAGGEVVTIDRLVDGLYGADSPAGAVNALRSQVARLRRLLGDAVVSLPAGYRLEVDADDVDAHRFARLAEAGRKALDEGDHSRAKALLGEALGLWRGPALADVGGAPFAAAQAARLEELRIAAVEDRIEAALPDSNLGPLVGELRELVATNPLRERLYALLMTALAMSGRQAEALAVFEQARRTLADELGSDPSAELTAVHLDVLRGQLAGRRPAAQASPVQDAHRSAVPRMLPATIADFAGRVDHLAAIRQAVDVTGDGDRHLAVPVVVISGRAGVGKTTLAVHAAHSLLDRFPDGQLFANVHAATTQPVTPAQILQRFLRMLGVHGAVIPDSVDERAEMLRNLLAQRRTLIVLDDVDGEDSVVPLIPGGRSCAVIVTCRRRLPGLAGAAGVELGRFDAEQSLELLSRIIGGDRVGQEADDTRSLADLCGHLPLALRIAGARLATRPHWSIRQMTDRLADEEHRLDELMHGGMAISASVRLIHDALSPQARRLLRLLAILDAYVFAGWTVAALLDLPLGDAQDRLDELVEAHLVEPVGTGRGVHSHYRFHDLIRGFARRQLAAEEPAGQRSAALVRALDAMLCLSRAAAPLEPDDPLRLSDRSPTWSPPSELLDTVTADPGQWLEREHAMIVAAVHQAARNRLPELCWALAMSIRHFLILRAYEDDALAVLNAALHAARQMADLRCEAAALLELGNHDSGLRNSDDAGRRLSAAEAIFRQLKDERGVAIAIRGRAFLSYGQGRTAEAARLLEQALETARSLGLDREIGYILQVLASISLLHGDVAAAKTLLAEAIDRARASGNPRVVAQALRRTGQAQLEGGDLALAAGTLDEALALARDAGDAAGEAHILVDIGSTYLHKGEPTSAHDVFSQAGDRARTANDALAEAHASFGLGEVALGQDRPEQAVAFLQRAVDLYRGIGSRIHHARALATLGDAWQAAGHLPAARISREEALRLTADMDPAVSVRLQARIAS